MGPKSRSVSRPSTGRESKTGPRRPRPGFGEALDSAAALGAEAVGAIDRLAVGRAERDLGFLATARAGRREHLPGPAGALAVAAATAAVSAGGISATTAVPGVIAAAARVRAAAAIATA